MDVPADRSRPTSALPTHSSLRGAARSPRRRRPTGAAPPLPYRLQTSGVGWLVAAVVLVGLTLAIFAHGLRGPAVTATVIDDAVVGWLVGLYGPGAAPFMGGVARISSWSVLYAAYYGLLLALLVLRRWRHLLVWVVAVLLGGNLLDALAMITRRPRPFGVDIQASWGGWALPSVQVAFLTAILMGVLYTLVPEGRWRNLGKWLAATLITLVALARMALGADAPTDVLVGVGIGVTIPLLLFRRFAPNEVYPVTYRRGRSAHLDVGGARGVASGAGWPTSWAWSPPRSSRSACRDRPGRPRCASPWRATRPGSCSASCTPRATSARTAGTSSAASSSTAAWRTRSRSTPCGASFSRRTTRCR
jgi:membrane-associated phospholipid phosphatase